MSTTKTDVAADAWSLEVVRGPDAGRRYVLGSGAVVLGNALDGEPGIDLSDQETTAPRKMAGRQARIDVANGSLVLRDLDSPGGTFINRQRVRAGEARSLQVGDVIQLGGVQLSVARGGSSAPKSEPRPSPPPSMQPAGSAFLFTLKSGAACRSWDDFLAVSAQRWDDLRDELTSGRLARFLDSIRRGDLAPDPHAPGTPDERLDAWIGRLPILHPAKPELDVHPRTLVIRAPAGGGVIRRKIQVSNAGHRLLKFTGRVEPGETSWLKIAAEFAGRSIATVDSSEITIEVDVPEAMTEARSAHVVFEGNGGTVRVAVQVESADPKEAEPASVAPRGGPAFGLREKIFGQSATMRLVAWPLVAALFRVILALLDGLFPSEGGSPGLFGPALLLGFAGAVVAVILSMRGHGEMRDLPPSALTGAILGAMLAAIGVAASRTVEGPVANVLGIRWFVAGLLWAVLAAGVAGLSLVLLPPTNGKEVRP